MHDFSFGSLVFLGVLGTFVGLAEATTPLPPPTVTILAPVNVTIDKPFTVAWLSTYATTCNLTGGGPGWAQSGAGASGSKSQMIPTPGSVTYAVTCTGSGGTGSATEVVRASTAASFPPAVRLDAPSGIARGKPFALSWASTNARFCSLTGGGPGWAQALAGTAGSKTQAILSATTYTVSCTGPLGTRTVSKTVKIAPAGLPLPSILVYLPASVVAGQWFTVSWSSTHARYCHLTGGGPGWMQSRVGTSGFKTQVVSIPGSVAYTIACVGPGGSTKKVTRTVTVMAPVMRKPLF